ncbi:MAG: polysaccharide biosynthesis tyrosine autokinase [Lachnospiraceae bacterium]|nr:polysaccharide biosynthesis tyrosine autokinase [Lachnospiraceae bacterium]
MPFVQFKDKQKHYQLDEAIKMLRTNIEFSGEDIQTICITSCLPNEGKSSIAVRLAMSMAEAGKKVALVDGDMRNSVMVGQFEIEGENLKGLSHFLTGQGTLAECMCQTGYPNMQMVFSGPETPNPSELLGGKRFAALLEALRKNYDYVILDTPPLGSVIDAAIVARQCDGVALVIASGEISYKFAQSVKAQLEKSECRILGCILNKVDMESDSFYGKYYGKYYGKHYGRYGGKRSKK